LRGAHMDSLPFVYNDHHAPLALNNSPHEALAMALANVCE
jgi:hypothetical protein